MITHIKNFIARYLPKQAARIAQAQDVQHSAKPDRYCPAREDLYLKLTATLSRLPGSLGVHARMRHHEMMFNALPRIPDHNDKRNWLQKQTRPGMLDDWIHQLRRIPESATADALMTDWIFLPDAANALVMLLGKLAMSPFESQETAHKRALQIWKNVLDSNNDELINKGLVTWALIETTAAEKAAPTQFFMRIKTLFDEAFIAYLLHPNAKVTISGAFPFLESDNPVIRMLAAKIVARGYAAASLGSLQNNATSRYPEVRICVANELILFGRTGLPILQVMLYDKDVRVQHAARQAIKAVNEPVN